MNYCNTAYLSMIDCGLDGIAIWWELRGKTGAAIAALLNKLFLERSPLEEILIDNGKAFKSAPVKAVLIDGMFKPTIGLHTDLVGTAS